jgi:hypothetical protein
MQAQTTLESEVKQPLSDKKLAANRANAQRSTGPRTIEGKARSALNATTHAGFAAATLLPHEDPEPFLRFRKAWVKTYSPQTLPELYLIDRAISLAWRLRRLQAADTDLHCVHPERTPSQNLARAYCVDADSSSNNQFDRLMRAEDRLQGMLHRTLKQFHHLQETQLKIQPSIHCPFLEDEASSPSPGTPGEGRGEGSAPTTDSAVLQNQPTAHDKGEKPQNEPTADPSPSEISNLNSEIPSVSSVISVVHSSPGQNLQNEPTAPHQHPGAPGGVSP